MIASKKPRKSTKNGSRKYKVTKRVTKSGIPYEVGSENIFADLGLPNPELLMAKARLVQKIRAAIESQKLTQRQAADLIGIDQPKISALLCGKTKGYSLERLFHFLNALGQNVEIALSPIRNGKPATTTVTR